MNDAPRKKLKPSTSKSVMSFKSIKSKDNWTGSDWTILDENGLAEMIARVAVGQYLHVMRVLNEVGTLAYAPTQNAKDSTIALLTARDEENAWHRDGWMFQTISWIAAHLQDAETMKSPPHMIPADKGFDGLHLRLDETNGVVMSVIICEEKATSGPRGKIKGQVWPEFESIESGERENELVSETSTLLTSHGYIDPEQAVHNILWHQARSYRVAITVSDKENSKRGREALFKGYEKVVVGKSAEHRRTETLYLKKLRKWMTIMAAKAICAVNTMETLDV